MPVERVLCFEDPTVVWPRTHCCDEMAEQVTLECDMHPNPFDCGDRVAFWSAQYDEYGLVVHDGGATYILVQHCPWCGTALPESRRDRWFDELEAMGFEDPLQGDIPERYRSDAWYRDDTAVA